MDGELDVHRGGLVVRGGSRIALEALAWGVVGWFVTCVAITLSLGTSERVLALRAYRRSRARSC